MQTDTYLFSPFVAKRGTDHLIAGPVSAEVVDIDGQMADAKWLKSALPQWMTFGNIREMHSSAKGVGKAQSLDTEHVDGPFIVARIADNECWNKIEAGVYSGFSIGVRNARIVNDGRAPRGTIVGGDIIEVSVVDHPAVRKAAFSLVTKSAGGWMDTQSGMTFAALPEISDEALLTKSVAAENTVLETPAERIARMAYARHTLSEGSSIMPDNELLTKGADRVQEDDEDEDGQRTPGHKNDFDAHDDPDDDDDYLCERCGKDARHCECYKNLTKAAADFEDKEAARDIRPGHPIPKGHSSPASTHDAMHEGPEIRNAPFDHHDAEVRLDYIIRKAEHLVARMADALDSGNSAGFNPNDPEYHVRSGPPPGDPNAKMGQNPDLNPKWNAPLPENNQKGGSYFKKNADLSAEDVYKIAADVTYVALQEFFGNNSNITKGAQSHDPTKAAYVNSVQGIAETVTLSAFDQLADRLAKVEKMAVPSKGFANVPNAHQPAPQTPLDPLQRARLDADLTKSVQSMPDELQRNNAASFFAGDWSHR